MGLKSWLASAAQPQPTFQERYQANLAKAASKGQIAQCRECGTSMPVTAAECPRCTCPTDPAAPRRTVIVRNYHGGKAIQQFQADAAFLAQFGWQPQAQTAGGMGRGLGVGIEGIGVLGGRKARDMTVTFIRSA